MKKFASYAVEFKGCAYLLDFDFCIEYVVVSDSELVVAAWVYEGHEIIDGEFTIKGLQGSFDSTYDCLDLVRFLLDQYCRKN